MGKISELRDMTDEQLQRELKSLRDEGLMLRFKKFTGRQDNSARFRAVRRRIAQALTLIGERRRHQTAA